MAVASSTDVNQLWHAGDVTAVGLLLELRNWLDHINFLPKAFLLNSADTLLVSYLSFDRRIWKPNQWGDECSGPSLSNITICH